MESDIEKDFSKYSKVLLFGSLGVGKKTFINQIENGNFLSSLPEGSENFERFYSKRLQIKTQKGNETWIDLYYYQVLSKASNYSENELDLLNDYLFQCQCILLFIDITSPQTFEDIKTLIQNIRLNDNQGTSLYFVSNKTDLKSTRKISENDIKDYLSTKGKKFKYIELSIKTGKGYDELINNIYNSTQNNDSKIPGNAISKFTRNYSYASKIFSKSLNTFRIVMIGDSSVGKTAFSNRYFKNEYQEYFMSTIGISDESVYLKIGGEYQKLTLWDTAGQERFRSLPKTYYQNADGIFLFFDVNSQKSFDNLESGWMTEIHERANQQDNNNAKFTVYLIGNKVDDIENRKVSMKMANEKAQRLGLKYFETSCKLNLNINEVINNMMMDLYEKHNKGREIFILGEGKRNEKGCCKGVGEEKKKK